MKYLIVALLAVLLTGCGRGEEMPELDITLTNPVSEETEHMVETAALEETVAVFKPELLMQLVSPEDSDFVRVTDYIPDVSVELKYATSENFTGQVIYQFEDVFLRYGTVMKLKAVRDELAALGYGLKIWDGFRPVSAQFTLWEVCPDDTYVANPNKGFSNHSRGFAVDVTLVDNEGRELEMPTGFDDFSGRADRDYSDCAPAAATNAIRLESVMEKHGFQGYWGEWWHFNDTQKYDVEDAFDPGVICLQPVKRDTPLLKHFYESDSMILVVPEGEFVTLLGYKEGFAMAEYWGYRGWITLDDLK